MEELIKEYESRLRLDGKSEKTIRAYTVSIKEYFKWFYDNYHELEDVLKHDRKIEIMNN